MKKWQSDRLFEEKQNMMFFMLILVHCRIAAHRHKHRHRDIQTHRPNHTSPWGDYLTDVTEQIFNEKLNHQKMSTNDTRKTNNSWLFHCDWDTQQLKQPLNDLILGLIIDSFTDRQTDRQPKAQRRKGTSRSMLLRYSNSIIFNLLRAWNKKYEC